MTYSVVAALRGPCVEPGMGGLGQKELLSHFRLADAGKTVCDPEEPPWWWWWSVCVLDRRGFHPGS